MFCGLIFIRIKLDVVHTSQDELIHQCQSTLTAVRGVRSIISVRSIFVHLVSVFVFAVEGMGMSYVWLLFVSVNLSLIGNWTFDGSPVSF